jgi:hypothetical protein
LPGGWWSEWGDPSTHSGTRSLRMTCVIRVSFAQDDMGYPDPFAQDDMFPLRGTRAPHPAASFRTVFAPDAMTRLPLPLPKTHPLVILSEGFCPSRRISTGTGDRSDLDRPQRMGSIRAPSGDPWTPSTQATAAVSVGGAPWRSWPRSSSVRAGRTGPGR